MNYGDNVIVLQGNKKASLRSLFDEPFYVASHVDGSPEMQQSVVCATFGRKIREY